MEFTTQGNTVTITTDKREVVLSQSTVTIDGLTIDFPGEYEKSEILTSAHKQGDLLVFSLRIEGRDIAYIANDALTLDEGVVDFFGNIDLLVIHASKASVKLYEELDARVVIPFGEDRPTFLTTIGQSNAEEMTKYKSKEADFDGENTLFVNLVG